MRNKLVYTCKVLKTLTDVAEVFDPVTLGLVIYVKKIIMRQCKNIYIHKVVHRKHIDGRGKLETS